MSDSPATPIETELKLALPSEAGYRALRAALGPPARERLQHNLFFDTPDHRLGHARWGLRLRRESDPRGLAPPEASVALKGPARHAHGAVHRVDLELPLPVSVWQEARARGALLPDTLPEPVRGLLHGAAPGVADRCAPPLPLRVQFENRRSAYPVTLGGKPLTLLLDRTAYPTGQVDCEVEIEVAVSPTPGDPEGAVLLARVGADARALLGRHGVHPLEGRPAGKLSRALRYLEEAAQPPD